MSKEGRKRDLIIYLHKTTDGLARTDCDSPASDEVRPAAAVEVNHAEPIRQDAGAAVIIDRLQGK